MGRNSVSYNNVLCCAATGVENNEGGGFEVMHGDHAVRLHGRTYHFLTSSSGNAGLNFFTFDSSTNCMQYATNTLNNESRGYQRIIPSFLHNIFNELKEYNIICQECEQIGCFAKDYMDSNSTIDTIATINETTSYLDVAQITNESATGNRIITFQRKGKRKATSLSCTDKMWEPFVYPLLFFHAERGWGKDIRKELRYTDYLVARLLCPEKIELNGVRETLRVPNQSLDKFIRPIIRQLLGPERKDDEEDEAYHYYTKLFDGPLRSSKVYSDCIKALLTCFFTELLHATQISGFDKFCNIMLTKLSRESLYDVGNCIQSYIKSRRDDMQLEEEIESSLTEVLNFHTVTNLKKGRMTTIPTNRFQLMNRLSQTYLVDSISRAIDYRLRFHRFHQKDLFGIGADDENDNLEENHESSGKTFLSQRMHG